MSAFQLTDEEQMLQEAAAAYVRDRAPVRLARKLRDEAPLAGHDAGLWAEMVKLGWPGIAIDEPHGGSGLGIRALLLVIEELGSTLAPTPLLQTGLLAATLIGRFGDGETATRWLPRIADGGCIAALASEGEIRIEDGRLDGAVRFVHEGAAATLLLVCARSGDGDVVALVKAGEPGASITAYPTIDGRGMADIRFEGARIDALLHCPSDYARDVAAIGLAAEMLGASAQAFETTIDYLRTRRQFGRAIGSFQALQHRAAKLLIEIELTRSCVGAAADALHRDDPGMPMLASLAKASAGELMRLTGHETIQLHGGIGMTDAHDAGLYLKRGRVAAMLHGDAAFHTDRYARLSGF